MDTPTYTYKGKLWTRCPTVSDTNSFFHSAFGVKSDDNNAYFDNQAKFRRMRWATFLTYFENGSMPPCLAEVLQKCLCATNKYKHASIDDKQSFAKYIFDVTIVQEAVTKEEISVLATLENTKVVLLSEGTPDAVTVTEPNQSIFGSYPKETPKEKPKEVVLCLDGNVYTRLEPLHRDCSPISDTKVMRRANSRKYRKGGSAGSKGVEYQVSLLALVTLNALRNALNGWKLSTENEEAGKFDDIVVEWPQGAVLIQSKHKENNKRIGLEELTSTNSKNDYFSLSKYFLSYMLIKEKFKVENVIICTNACVHEEALEIFSELETNSESLLYYEGGNCTYYTLNDKFLPYLKEKTIQYYQQNFGNKGIEESAITDENLKDFAKYLQVYFNYPSLKSLEGLIEKLLSTTKCCSNSLGKITSKEIISKVMGWFQQKEGVYLTELHANALVAEIWRDKYCQKLEECKVTLQRNDLAFQCPQQVYHVITKGRGLLEIIKVYLALRERKANILIVHHKDDVNTQKQVAEAFKLPQYAYLVIIWLTITEKSAVLERFGKLKELLETYKHKKIILVAKDDKLAQHIGFGDTVHVDGSMTFDDLSFVVQTMLIKKNNINFQSKRISLEKLCTLKAAHGYGAIMDEESLEKLIRKEEIKVGAPLTDLDELTRQYYINRTFTRKSGNGSEEEVEFLDEKTRQSNKWCEETFPENSIFDVDEKLILISDGAGMGKSTVLVKLALTIKENHPYLWVIRITINDYTKVLGELLENRKDTLDIKELLDSRDETTLTNHLEECIFSYNQKVVLMLDGIDEISPDYTGYVLSLIKKCREEPNFIKIFITSRPHVSKELEAVLKVKPFILKPFTKCNQIDFIINYWEYNLEPKDNASKKKYKQYAKQVIDIISWVNLSSNRDNHFASIPLHVRMAAEIFQDTVMEGVEPNLTKKINVTELYELFVQKKWDIFCKKENPDRKTWINQELSKQLDKYLLYHRSLALEMTVDKNKLHHFLNYQRIGEHAEISLLKIGIVQKINDNIGFIHNTFSDYFLAENLLLELQQNQSLEFQVFLIDTIFLEPQYNNTRIFFDSLLRKVIFDIHSNIFEKYQSVKQENTVKSNKSELLHVLAEEGCIAILQLILKCIAIDSNDDTAANTNTLHVLKRLVGQFGIDIKDNRDRTPLHRAVLKGRTDVVKFLTAQGNVNCPNDNVAAVKLSADVKMKDRDGYTALHLATASGHLDIVEFLVDYGLDLNDIDFSGRTPLHLASTNGYLETVKYLVNSGAERNVKNKSWNTALHSAASFGKLDVVKFLVESGLGLNEKGFRSRTPLHLASVKGHLDTVKFLLEVGADFEVRENDGYTALQVAATSGETDVVKFLMEYGLDLNVTDNKGRTPLHSAAVNGHLKTVKFLVDAGVDCHARSSTNNTVLHSAASYGQLEVVKFLIGRGLDLNDKGFRGQTPLHLASVKGHLDMVKFLLEAGADFKVRENDGYTALRLAANCGQEETVKFFEGCGLDFDGAETRD